MQGSDCSAGERRVVKTTCGMCFLYCGINVYVEDGRITRVEGMPECPSNRGGICVKGRNAVDQVYSDERLKYPMKRENGSWKRISWDEALDAIVTKLRESKEKYGATSLAVFAGDPVGTQERLGWDMIWRFCDVYGAPSRFMDGHICANIRYRAYFVTFGKMMAFDVENSKCIILWAGNPHKSTPTHVAHYNTAIERGAKLIVIDPRRIPFAKRADIHIQPRPGTDGALALAMLNIIISEGLYDREFVENWTVGFDKLAEHVKHYPAEWAERITGVAAEDIKKIARIYATTKPACIRSGVGTLDQCACGFHNARSLSILQAITGNIDTPGGWVRASSGVHERPARLPEKMAGMKLTGADKYPIFHEAGGHVFNEGCMVDWPNLILVGKPYSVKTMIVSGANPVVTWPNSMKVKQALEKLDFLVVMDVFMTPTAKMADIVLPACTFLERLFLCRIYETECIPMVMLNKPVIEPLWESWSDCRFWLELAKRMGYEEYFPWKSDEEALDYFLHPSGLTVKYLRDEHPTGIIYGKLNYDEYKEKGMRTPSGKIELYSEELERLGYDPLPTYREPPESPISTPELAKEYPLVLTTGARELEWWHSQHRNLPGLRRRNPEPTAEIHPDTARKYGIGDGEPMIVETERGSLEVKARVTEDIIPELVSLGHTWPEASENILTDDTPADPISGYPAFKALLCKVRTTT